MIQVSELRIGNLVNFSDDWFKKKYAEISCIQRHCVLIKDFVGTPKIEDIHPILITPDTLEVMGFKDTGTRIVGRNTPIEWKLPDYTEIRKEYDDFVYVLCTDDWSNIIESVVIKSIHHLQNIHYYITGEEISITPVMVSSITITPNN